MVYNNKKVAVWGTVMNADEGAKIFHDWAFTEGFLVDGLPSPQPATAAQIALLQPITDLGRQLLRIKQIQAVGFNEARNEIIVFTKRAAPSSKKQLITPNSN